jgi:hypothetical protein
MSRKVARILPGHVALIGAALAGCQIEAPAPDEGPPALEWAEQAAYDCSERQDRGYVQGDPFAITVVTVDGEPVERETANAYIVMQDAAAADGVGIRIVSGFRTMAEQEELYACYTNCNCNNCNLAARPGYSNHQSGHALDLNTAAGGVLRWLNAHGGDYGFERTVPSEDWHWEWWGGGPGGGPCLGIPCPVLPAEGGVVDDGGPCFRMHGPSQYWRKVNDQGNEGGLHWTNAFTSDNPDNWARWKLDLAAAGDYEVSVLTGGPYGLWSQTRYGVGHAGATEAIMVDQSAVEGWQSLGVFHFEAGGDQFVDVYDDFAGDVPADQHILADAVRLTPFVPPEPDAAPVADADTAPPTDAGTAVDPPDGTGAPGFGDAGDKPGLGDGGADPVEPPDGPDAAEDGFEGAGGGRVPTSVATAFGPTPRKVSYQGSAGCSAVPGPSGGALPSVVAALALAGVRRRRRNRSA